MFKFFYVETLGETKITDAKSLLDFLSFFEDIIKSFNSLKHNVFVFAKTKYTKTVDADFLTQQKKNEN